MTFECDVMYRNQNYGVEMKSCEEEGAKCLATRETAQNGSDKSKHTVSSRREISFVMDVGTNVDYSAGAVVGVDANTSATGDRRCKEFRKGRLSTDDLGTVDALPSLQASPANHASFTRLSADMTQLISPSTRLVENSGDLMNVSHLQNPSQNKHEFTPACRSCAWLLGITQVTCIIAAIFRFTLASTIYLAVAVLLLPALFFTFRFDYLFMDSMQPVKLGGIFCNGPAYKWRHHKCGLALHQHYEYFRHLLIGLQIFSASFLIAVMIFQIWAATQPGGYTNILDRSPRSLTTATPVAPTQQRSFINDTWIRLAENNKQLGEAFSLEAEQGSRRRKSASNDKRITRKFAALHQLGFHIFSQLSVYDVIRLIYPELLVLTVSTILRLITPCRQQLLKYHEKIQSQRIEKHMQRQRLQKLRQVVSKVLQQTKRKNELARSDHPKLLVDGQRSSSISIFSNPENNQVKHLLPPLQSSSTFNETLENVGMIKSKCTPLTNEKKTCSQPIQHSVMKWFYQCYIYYFIPMVILVTNFFPSVSSGIELITALMIGVCLTQGLARWTVNITKFFAFYLGIVLLLTHLAQMRWLQHGNIYGLYIAGLPPLFNSTVDIELGTLVPVHRQSQWPVFMFVAGNILIVLLHSFITINALPLAKTQRMHNEELDQSDENEKPEQQERDPVSHHPFSNIVLTSGVEQCSLNSEAEENTVTSKLDLSCTQQADSQFQCSEDTPYSEIVTHSHINTKNNSRQNEKEHCESQPDCSAQSTNSPMTISAKPHFLHVQKKRDSVIPSIATKKNITCIIDADECVNQHIISDCAENFSTSGESETSHTTVSSGLGYFQPEAFSALPAWLKWIVAIYACVGTLMWSFIYLSWIGLGFLVGTIFFGLLPAKFYSIILKVLAIYSILAFIIEFVFAVHKSPLQQQVRLRIYYSG